MTGVAIIIPTLGRAEMLPALIENIRDTTRGPHRVYFIVEEDDAETIEVLRGREGVTLGVGKFGSCSVAINAGYRASTEPFVAIANDDCWFHDGWDEAALRAFQGPPYQHVDRGDDKARGTVHVVGMNDGHGDQLCFPMVRRSFIEEHSGVFDVPNAIFHTYKSQGPDTEFSFYAILRGVWAPAPDAIVEHRRIAPELHQKARDTITTDLEEYMRRWPLWDPECRMPPPSPTVQPSTA